VLIEREVYQSMGYAQNRGGETRHQGTATFLCDGGYKRK
jgi:hypothetical protein